MVFRLRFRREPEEPTDRLTGQALLDWVTQKRADNPDMSKSELCRSCGYVNEHDKPAFTAFYEALLEAKQL